MDETAAGKLEEKQDEEQRRDLPDGEAEKSGFVQSRTHALLVRMFDVRRGGFLGYASLYALCRLVRTIFQTG